MAGGEYVGTSNAMTATITKRPGTYAGITSEDR